VPRTLTVPGRCNGPVGRGQGGYVGGLLAGVLGGPTATANLRAPVPLDAPLRVEEGEDGALRLLDGETTVADAARSPDLPAAAPRASLAEARRARAAYRGPTDGPLGSCFVCGRTRPDSLGVFAGELPGRGLVASPWAPPDWADDGDGAVRLELLWAVLDCPTYFAAYMGREETLAFLVRQTVTVHAPVPAAGEHVLVAWPLGLEGRKADAGAALLSASGEVLASCRALLVEPRPRP